MASGSVNFGILTLVRRTHALCRRLVTADAMEMAKERDRTEVVVDGTGSENRNKHSETPRCTEVWGSP